MPLNALPVTPDELEDLQFGLTFNTNTGQATSQAALINLDNGVDTVASYAAALLNANIATSQVAMATTCLMWGETQDPAFLDNTASVAAPLFIALAIQLGTNQVVTAAEGIGVALANDAQFAPFLALNTTQFATAVAAATGVNVTAINTWLANWIDFYTTFGTPAPGVTVQEAAYGATFGDAIGTALLNPTSANLQTVTSTNAQGETVIEGDIANAPAHHCHGSIRSRYRLRSVAGAYAVAGRGWVGAARAHYRRRYATRVRDRPRRRDFHCAARRKRAAGNDQHAQYRRYPGEHGWRRHSELHGGEQWHWPREPPFAIGVTMTGIATANILNLTDGVDPNDLAGFAGDITGLTTLTLQEGSNPFGHVQVGLPGLGLNTALETLNINAGLIQIDSATPDDFGQWGRKRLDRVLRVRWR